MILALLPIAATLLLADAAVAVSVFGTSFTGTVTNFPGSDTALIAFDGLDEAVGNSGLMVSESGTMIGSLELVEFTLTTADGEPFIGQQDDSMATSNVEVTGLQGFGDPSPLEAIEDSGFVYLTIDGVPVVMMDLQSRGLVFVPHPLDPQIQVLLVKNKTTDISFGTVGVSAFEVFSALLGSTDAALVDGVHLGVALAVPEPSTSLAVPLLAGLMIGVARLREHLRGRTRRAL